MRSHNRLQIFVFLVCTLICLTAVAGKITGTVYDQHQNILPFASILVKGSTIGTTANSQGQYFLNLPSGTYHIICQHVGFTKSEKEIKVNNEPLVLNFVLNEQELSLSEIVVKAGAEDPAYAIIRQAIKKKSFYKTQVASF